MKYLPVLSHNVKLSCSSVNRAAALSTERRYFSEVILASKVTPNITKSSDFFKTLFRVKSMVGVIFPTPRQEGLKGLTGEELLSIAYWPIGMTYHSFCFTRILFLSTLVIPHTNPVMITIQALGNWYSLTFGCHSIQPKKGIVNVPVKHVLVFLSRDPVPFWQLSWNVIFFPFQKYIPLFIHCIHCIEYSIWIFSF